ncbi:MAG: lipopolysaccharide transport periplasmic protein LptA [Pelovirga sp.]
MNLRLIFNCLLFFLFGCVWNAAAVDFFAAAQSDAPLEISSRELEVFRQQQQSVFTGDVVAQQGDMTLYTDQLTVLFDEQDEVRRIEADGSVRIEDLLRNSRAERAVFDREEQTLILSGDAEVVQGDNRISGDEIILFLDENRSLVKSNDSGRVRAVILPEQKPETP